MRWMVPLVVVLASMSGCLGPGGGSTPPAAADGDATGDGNLALPGAGNESGEMLPLVGEPEVRTLNLTADGRLTNESVTAGRVSFPGGFQDFATGFKVLEFESEPLEEPLVLLTETVALTAWISSDVPQPSNGQFDLLAWAGSDRNQPLIFFSGAGVAAFTPGVPVKMDITLDWPDGVRPLVLPAGDRLVVWLYTGLVNEGTGVVKLHVGGDTLSAATFTVAPLGEDPLARSSAATEERFTGTLSNLATDNCASQEDVNWVAFPVTGAENLTFFEATVDVASPQSIQTDLDIVLRMSGTILARTTSPYARESILLAGPATEGLAGASLELQVYACTGANAPFEVVVRQA